MSPKCVYLRTTFLLGHFHVFGIFFGPLFTKNALQCSARHFGGEDEIPPAVGRRYLGAARGGPCNPLIHSRRA